MEMDFGKTGGAKVAPAGNAVLGRGASSSDRMITIHPPFRASIGSLSPEADEDDEGISTIKVSALPILDVKVMEHRPHVEEDLEADFALPLDMTRLSLRPSSLHHRISKASLEWGDRDHTSSSASSSDAYSSLGFNVEASPSTSSNSTSASLPGTDDDCDGEDDGDLDGLVIPSGLFESDQGRKHLTKLLDMKKKLPKVEEVVSLAPTDPEDDFEIGLVINGDDDFSPSKLVQNTRTKRLGTLTTRSNSAPARPPSVLRPPSRLKTVRPKSPIPGRSSIDGSSRASISPPHRPAPTRRAHTFQALPPPLQPPSSFTQLKSSVLRNQKSHSVLKSPSPPNSAHSRLNRKASLSSLMESSSTHASGSGSGSSGSPPPLPTQGYSLTTAASRARTHTHSTSRMHAKDLVLPPSRPSTPSSNPAALRLTMPTSSSRLKSRPPISSVFPGPTQSATASAGSSAPRSPPRPSASYRQTPLQPALAPAKIVRRAKRRMYGDGTELDGFEDLPTDGDKEARFRVQAKGSQNRIPGATYARTDKDSANGTIRKRKETSGEPAVLEVSYCSLSKFLSSQIMELSQRAHSTR